MSTRVPSPGDVYVFRDLEEFQVVVEEVLPEANGLGKVVIFTTGRMRYCSWLGDFNRAHKPLGA